ncbi:MAG: hypothetical protein QXG91_01230 [Candidatus Aenigmatarchaeota archaeon]
MEKRKIKILKKIIAFLIVFNLMSILMYVVLYFEIEINFLKIPISYLAYQFFRLMWNNVEWLKEEASVEFKDKNLVAEISTDSTGWKSLYALFSLILSANFVRNKFSFKFKRKELKFLFLVLVAIFLINFFRIITTIQATLLFGLEVFDIFHTLLWREMMIFFVVFFFYIYIRKFGF